MAGLNERQRRFVEMYTSGPEGVRGNATASYYTSGYHPRNEATARANAARLLTNANVQREIQRVHRRAEAAYRTLPSNPFIRRPCNFCDDHPQQNAPGTLSFDWFS